MELVKQNDPADLDTFIDFLYDGLEGFVYLAARNPSLPKDHDKYWLTEFFAYPSQVDKLKSTIINANSSHDIYMAPALFKEKRPGREYVKTTNVVWADFDGNAPDWTDSHGTPSLIIQSSGSKHQHAYWRLQQPLTNVDDIDRINRNLAYNLQADTGAWDACRVLRPPNTLNHKRGGVPVLVKSATPVTYDNAIFDTIAPAPEQPDTSFDLTTLPDVQSVILKYPFPADMVLLFKKDKPEDRSAALMNLAYGCAEMGMEDKEIFAILLLADDKWEKFKKRKDRHQRLAQIINVARSKHPLQVAEAEEEAFTVAFPYQSFLDTEINIDWVIEPMLMEQGSMIMVGPSGIGKTQISLQFMIHLALGKNYLHYKIAAPQRIVFLSLEMDHGSLKQFLMKMNEGLTDDERLLLQENFIIVPHGEPWALNTVAGQEYLLNLLVEIEPQGLFIDSIGSSIKGAISSDEAVQPYLDFVDRLRKKFGMFVWAIHHMRKNQQGQSHGHTQDDIYGNQYLLNRASSAYGVLHGKNGTIKMRAFKSRLAAKEDDYLIKRVDNLNFEKFNAEVDGMLNKFVQSTDPDDDGPPPSDQSPNGFVL